MNTQNTRPDHLFVGVEGDLYRTDRPDWTSHPLRKNFERTHRAIESVADLKATLRAGEWAWPGGYPMFLLASDGGCLHFECVRREMHNVVWSLRNDCSDGWKVVACDVNYEDSEMVCDHCGERIESAYGEDG